MKLLECLLSLNKGTKLRILYGDDAMELVSVEQEVQRLKDSHSAVLDKEVFVSVTADEPFVVIDMYPDGDAHELYMENTFSDKEVVDKLSENNDTVLVDDGSTD